MGAKTYFHFNTLQEGKECIHVLQNVHALHPLNDITFTFCSRETVWISKAHWRIIILKHLQDINKLESHWENTVLSGYLTTITPTMGNTRLTRLPCYPNINTLVHCCTAHSETPCSGVIKNMLAVLGRSTKCEMAEQRFC